MTRIEKIETRCRIAASGAGIRSEAKPRCDHAGIELATTPAWRLCLDHLRLVETSLDAFERA